MNIRMERELSKGEARENYLIESADEKLEKYLADNSDVERDRRISDFLDTLTWEHFSEECRKAVEKRFRNILIELDIGDWGEYEHELLDPWKGWSAKKDVDASRLTYIFQGILEDIEWAASPKGENDADLLDHMEAEFYNVLLERDK